MNAIHVDLFVYDDKFGCTPNIDYYVRGVRHLCSFTEIVSNHHKRRLSTPSVLHGNINAIWANGRILNLSHPTGSNVLAHFGCRFGRERWKSVQRKVNTTQQVTTGCRKTDPYIYILCPLSSRLRINPSSAETNFVQTQGCKDFWKPSKQCHVGIHWKALTEYFQMSIHLPGFQSFSKIFASFLLARLSTSSIRVKEVLFSITITFNRLVIQPPWIPYSGSYMLWPETMTQGFLNISLFKGNSTICPRCIILSCAGLVIYDFISLYNSDVSLIVEGGILYQIIYHKSANEWGNFISNITSQIVMSNVFLFRFFRQYTVHIGWIGK